MRLIRLCNVKTLRDARDAADMFARTRPLSAKPKWRKTPYGASMSCRDARGTWCEVSREVRIVCTHKYLRDYPYGYYADERHARNGDDSWTDVGTVCRRFKGWTLPTLAIYRPYEFASLMWSHCSPLRIPKNSRFASECSEVAEKALAIKIPCHSRFGRVVCHSYDEGLCHAGFQIVSKDWAFDTYSSAFVLEPWLSLITHNGDGLDYDRSHSMTKSFFEIYSQPAGRLWTRAECEEFFNDNDNFYARRDPVEVETEILLPAQLGGGSVFSLSAFGRTGCGGALNCLPVRLNDIPRSVRKH